MIIREATKHDLDDCVAMSISFLEMTPYARFEADYESLEKAFNQSMADGKAFVAEDYGLVVGMVLGVECPLVFNNNITLVSELAWWVDEEYRDTKVGALLKNALRDASKGCVQVFSLLSTSPPHLKAYLLADNYIEGETAFFKEV